MSDQVPKFQNTMTQLIAAMRKHAINKGIVPIDTVDLIRLCDVAEQGVIAKPHLDEHVL